MIFINLLDRDKRELDTQNKGIKKEDNKVCYKDNNSNERWKN